jgi:PPOX class probable F420-dependent enzyme
MAEMSNKEIGNFLMRSTFTGKLSTVKKDGGPHVVPIWFVLDDGESRAKMKDIIFTTYDTSAKAENIQRDSRVCLCVVVFGTAKVQRYRQNELFKWATRIAEWYVGKEDAEAYGKRNSTKGAVVVRIKPTKIIAEKDVAAWEWWWLPSLACICSRGVYKNSVRINSQKSDARLH